MTKKHDKYTIECINMFGMQTEFKLCHLPFLVAEDVFGSLALEGSSGTGKTTMVKRIGALNQILTGGKVGVFSADKARYEDFVGVPIPDQTTGSMKIYPMPNSVAEMETVLIDEINRATYDNQEKWLSLIATREIDSIKTNCKYIYTAMNPILSEATDTYEGVQPLDKALGERVYALVTMPLFNKLDAKFRYEIMKSCFDQTRWEPDHAVVDLYKNYIVTARGLYVEYKDQLLDRVIEYTDFIQESLKTETKGAISIEARRAQYIVTNILAVHALDSVYKTSSLEVSALNALLISFPNRLWEQVISVDALKMAHERAKNLLKKSKQERDKSVACINSLNRIKDDMLKLLESKPSVEIISKEINQSLPDREKDTLNHYIFCVAAVQGLTENFDPKVSKTQSTIKEQEYSRLEKSYKSLISSNEYKKYEKLGKEFTETGKMPTNFVMPSYVQYDEDSQAADVFLDLLKLQGVGPVSLGLIELSGIEVETTSDILTVIEKLTTMVELFKTVREAYE